LSPQVGLYIGQTATVNSFSLCLLKHYTSCFIVTLIAYQFQSFFRHYHHHHLHYQLVPVSLPPWTDDLQRSAFMDSCITISGMSDRDVHRTLFLSLRNQCHSTLHHQIITNLGWITVGGLRRLPRPTLEPSLFSVFLLSLMFSLLERYRKLVYRIVSVLHYALGVSRLVPVYTHCVAASHRDQPSRRQTIY